MKEPRASPERPRIGARLAAAALSLSFLAPSGCVDSGKDSAKPEFQEDYLKAKESLGQVKAVAGRAELIFVGKVLTVGSPPAFRSGRGPAYQEVTYAVQEVLKGKLPQDAKDLKIGHLVISGSRNGNPEPGKNELSPQVFSPGSALIVMARKQREVWVDIHENYGVLRASEENVKAFKELVLKEGKEPVSGS